PRSLHSFPTRRSSDLGHATACVIDLYRRAAGRVICQACPRWLIGAKTPRVATEWGIVSQPRADVAMVGAAAAPAVACDRMGHRGPAAHGGRGGRRRGGPGRWGGGTGGVGGERGGAGGQDGGPGASRGGVAGWSAPRRARGVGATEWGIVRQPRGDGAILGGGPGGYEAALVAAQLGARVTVVEADGLGGACVLTDCVPSKTLIATSETMGILHGSADLGIRIEGYEGRMRPRQEALAAARTGPPASGPAGAGGPAPSGHPAPSGQPSPDGRPGSVAVDAPRLYGRVKALARAQSADVAARLAAEGVEVIAARGTLAGPHTVLAG